MKKRRKINKRKMNKNKSKSKNKNNNKMMMMNNKIKTRRRKIKILNRGNRDRTSSKILSQNNQKTFNKNKTHIRLGYHNCNKQKFRFQKHRNGISSRQQKTILMHNCDNQKSKKLQKIFH